MFNGEFFHYTDEVVFFVGTAAFFLICAEVAYIHGKHAAKNSHAELSAHAASYAGTLLGLLALLLGFAFGMSMSRFNERKALFLEEVNDIGTAYLRLDFIQNGNAKQLKQMFADYTQLRCDYYKNGTLAVNMADTLAATEKLQSKIWNLAAYNVRLSYTSGDVLSAASSTSIATAINSMFDAQNKRTASRNDHIPEAILWLLIFVASIAISTSSYALGLKGIRLFLPRLVFVLVITSVLSIILDLDRPIRGMIQISQDDMAKLHQTIVDDIAAKK